jgi:hypothetical protein
VNVVTCPFSSVVVVTWLVYGLYVAPVVSCGPPDGPLTTEFGKAYWVAEEKFNWFCVTEFTWVVRTFPNQSYVVPFVIPPLGVTGSVYMVTEVGLPRVV